MKTHTTSPIVTGASVLGVKYRDGVLLVTDTLASYGSLAKFTGVSKFRKVGQSTIIGASGEYSDFQYIGDSLDEIAEREWTQNDGEVLTPKSWNAYLCRLLHNRRNKMNPLLNQIVLGGVDPKSGETYLSYVDLYGTTFEDEYIATGYGAHLAIPILRERARLDMGLEEAIELLKHCMRILFYRDCRTTDRIQFARATREGVEVSAMEKLDTKWDHQLWTTPTIQLSTMLGASW
jgi:20S proteasome subunit beta 7